MSQAAIRRLWLIVLQGDPIDTFKPNWIEHRWAPFPVRIKVRSPKHAALIEREGKAAAETKY